MRGGVGGQGDRGGQGAKDDEPGSVSFLGFQSKDQGGAGADDSTRYHLWGLHGHSGVTPLQAQTCDLFQGQGAGQMAYALPMYFERAVRIRRLGTRTNGAVGTAGTPLIRIGIYANGTLGASPAAVAGSPYPGARMCQTDPINLMPGGVGANRRIEGLVDCVIQARSYVWAVIVFNASELSLLPHLLLIAPHAFPIPRRKRRLQFRLHL